MALRNFGIEQHTGDQDKFFRLAVENRETCRDTGRPREGRLFKRPLNLDPQARSVRLVHCRRLKRCRSLTVLTELIADGE